MNGAISHHHLFEWSCQSPPSALMVLSVTTICMNGAIGHHHLFEWSCQSPPSALMKSEDCVWKFARGKLWISFIEQGTTLSIPFDIFPTPIAVVRLFRGLRNVFLINR
nr:short transient receptor potential channel 3-like [Biomphalaria glabrata]